MTPRAREKPLIGITRSASRGWFMTMFNRLAVWRAGGRSLVLKPGEDIDVAVLDGLIVGGGDDIQTDLYNKEIKLTTRTDPERDKMELRLVRAAEERGLPVLGICRGAQMLNVARGGDLHVDMYEVFKDAPRLRTVLPRKNVYLANGSLLSRLIERNPARVNALHHQAVGRLGEGLEINARDEYGIVQGIEDPKADFAVGVQWHPEFLVQKGNQQNLFRALVKAAE